MIIKTNIWINVIYVNMYIMQLPYKVLKSATTKFETI